MRLSSDFSLAVLVPGDPVDWLSWSGKLNQKPVGSGSFEGDRVIDSSLHCRYKVSLGEFQ